MVMGLVVVKLERKPTNVRNAHIARQGPLSCIQHLYCSDSKFLFHQLLLISITDNPSTVTCVCVYIQPLSNTELQWFNTPNKQYCLT